MKYDGTRKSFMSPNLDKTNKKMKIFFMKIRKNLGLSYYYKLNRKLIFQTIHVFEIFYLSKVNFSRSLEQFFLTVGQNNFGNKIPFLANWKFNVHNKRKYIPKIKLFTAFKRSANILRLTYTIRLKNTSKLALTFVIVKVIV